MTENISPDQLVGEHVCDIDCWDSFSLGAGKEGDLIFDCNLKHCPGIRWEDYDDRGETLGQLIVVARNHCKEYHQ